MKRYRLLAVCPYEGLAESIKRVSGEFPQFEVDTAMGDSYSPEQLDTLLAEETYDLYLSRGGTARYIKSHTTHPCAEIPITLYDLLYIFRLLSSFPDAKPVLISNLDFAKYIELTDGLFSFDLSYRMIQDGEDIHHAIEECLDEGRDIVIGVGAVWQEAKRMGVPALLIMSSDLSIRSALRQAADLIFHNEQLKKKAAAWDYIVREQGGCWYIEDATGEVLFSNTGTVDPEILEEAKAAAAAMHGPVREGGFWHGTYYWEFRWSRETQWGPSPFHVLRVFESTELNEDINAACSIDKDTYVGDAVSVILHSEHSRESGRVREQIEECANLDLSVLIMGEDGTGRNSYAREIHKKSQWKNTAFVQIDCRELMDSSVSKLFSIYDGLLGRIHRATLYFAGIHALTKEHQREIFRFLTSRKHKGRYRVICSSIYSREKLLSSKILLKDLVELMAEVTIEVPSLSEEPELIVTITGMRLQSLNRRYGWKLQGIDQEGERYVREYDWPGNLNQLKDVLRSAASNMDKDCKTTLLKGSWIREAISRTDPIYRQDLSNVITTEGTLKEIERQVILKVLHECGMNQSLAAKRLAIGRSTIWRKLNPQEP